MTRARPSEAPESSLDDSDVNEPGPEVETPAARPGAGRGVLWAGLALIAVQALLRGWVGLRGFLSQDDYAFEYRAATMSLTSRHYLFDAWNGHLMPGSFGLVWVSTKLAPLANWPGVAIDLALEAATGVVLLMLLVELFGRRKAVLVPLALFLLTPATLTGFAWWAAALNQVPAMLGMVSCLYLHVKYLRSGRWRTGAMALVAFLLGLCFFEKMLLFAPVIFFFTVMYAVPGGWWRRLWGATALHWRVWVLWVVALGGYFAYYRTAVDSTVKGSTTPTAFLDLMSASWRGLHTTVLGGPWQWTAFGDPTNTVPAPGGLLSTVSTIVLLLVVVGSAVVYRQAARAWLLPSAYFVATAALLATGRNQIGPVIGLALRYYAEVALLAALALALALLPMVGVVAKGELLRLEPRSWVVAGLRRFGDPEGQRWSLSEHSRMVLVRGTVVALLASSILSTVRFDAHWHANPGAAYVATARQELARFPSNAMLYDNAVPQGMMGLLFFPYNSVSRALAPLPGFPRVLKTGGSATDLRILDDQGHVRLAYVGGAVAKPGPTPLCGWFASGPAGVVIPMAVPVFDFTWTMRIGYLASEDTRAVITAARQSVRVQLHKGSHAVYVQLSGPVGAVRIDGLAPGASVCTDDVHVGTPVALPG
ncbi:MAG: hypothetical protein JWP14_2922 [Frankiales bacterium]|nr:hypothetical protein [Frankiales bacterium]